MGIAKGTPNSHMVDVIAHLKACISDIAHPFLLPTVIVSYGLSPQYELRQREARNWLRNLEDSLRTMPGEIEDYTRHRNVDTMSQDLAECKTQVLWGALGAWKRVLAGLEEAAGRYWAACPLEKRDPQLDHLHGTLLSRVEFYHNKLDGIQNYMSISMKRLDILNNLVSDQPTDL
jgi:hypothetical protein